MIQAGLKSFMSQNWEDLLLLHWPVCPEGMRATIPSDLILDLHEGEAWASVVGFRLTNLRISPFRFLSWNDFLEVNLRTYVRDKSGRKGVWFHSLDSSDLPAVFGARALYGLSYFFSKVTLDWEGGGIHYRSRRKPLQGGHTAHLQAPVHRGSDEGQPADSSLDRFLLERYRFWARRTLCDESSSAVVAHRPYDAFRVEGAHYRGSLFKAWGMSEPASAPAVAHFCKGFPVSAYAPSWSFSMLGQANQR